MKKIYSKLIPLAAALAAAAGLSSCIGDLDTVPLNPYDRVPETAYGKDEAGYLNGLAKIYFQFVSNDTRDLQVSDGGAAELIRAFWSVQETTTDEAKCAWEADAWVRSLNTDTWTEAQNDATYAVYIRTLQGISYVNEYLRQTTDSKLDERGVDDAVRAKVAQFRAEARFLRAYFYWMAIDAFGNVPFVTEDSPFGTGVYPEQGTRQELFDYCIGELEDLISPQSAMPEARTNYPRADKGSVKGLLARMYLNAEVYSGTAMWQEARDMAKDIIDNLGYELADNYPDLFRGDNGENPDARKEFLFAAAYDAEQTQSYGGTTYLTLAAIAAEDIAQVPVFEDEEGNPLDEETMLTFYPNGVNNGWAGIRVPYEFVSRYFNVRNADYGTGEYECEDKRGAEGMFYIKGREESMDGALYKFTNGWSCLKFNNAPHDRNPLYWGEEAASKAYSDIDFPLIRLGEIYLIYAEACLRTHSTDDAIPYLQDLAERAGVEGPASSYTEDWILQERARELYWEGHRRTDLIRFGKFHSGDFLWPYKGGDSFNGQSFERYKTLFALPLTDLAANPTLKQNEGYPDNR